MTLLSTSALNALAVLVRVGSALVLNKIVAVFVGPSGYALIGQFQNAVTVFATFAGGAINNGVVKYTAEFAEDGVRRAMLWRTAGMLSLCGTSIVASFTVIWNKWIASSILGSEHYSPVILCLAVGMFFFVANALILAVVNGLRRVKEYVYISIFGSFSGLIVTGLLAMHFNLYGALLALVLNQCVIAFATFWILGKPTDIRVSIFWGRADRVIARKLLQFAMMALTSAAAVSLAQLAIRRHLAASFGWESAGYWQAVSRISDLYLMVVTGTLSLYYLPKLSSIRNGGELRAEIISGYRVILPAAAVGAACMFAFRDVIVNVLYTEDFRPMRGFFPWQFAGDVLKIASWLLGYVLVGQAMTRAYIVSEVVFHAVLVGLVIALTSRFGVVGASMGYCLTYLLHWVTMAGVVACRIRTLSKSV